jgi:hypothetical protein
MMRKALVVGIDYYSRMPPLRGCVNDARAVKAVLARNADGTVNFDVRLMSASEPAEAVSRELLKERIRELFADDGEIALLYFAGHGYMEATGGYLCVSDSRTGDDGLPLDEVLTLAGASSARHKIIILDSCHSGFAGADPTAPQKAELAEGLTILTASTAEQYASEQNGSGVFTTLLIDALNGAAANLLGEITPGSVYAHIDQSLGRWEQRPVFKTNVERFVSLRKVQPLVGLADLLRITEFFPTPGFELPLDPSFEPESPAPSEKNTAIFAILQKYNRVNLVVPAGAPHMWHAAMQSKACTLTVLGEHYRRLVERGRI